MKNKVVFIVHYYPPINSSGAKRVEALSKYLTRWGREVTVITTTKTAADGQFTEAIPSGVNLIELNGLGVLKNSVEGEGVHEPLYTGNASFKRRLKDFVMNLLGQIPDPRLPFAFSFLNPFLNKRVRAALESADVVVASCPPWATLLAALFVKWRFGKKIVLDYRDQFSECHEMPGSAFAKKAEKVIDKFLVKRAGALVTISEPMKSYYSALADNVFVVTNGYDSERIDAARSSHPYSQPVNGGVVVIRYMGIVSPGRVPHNVLSALDSMRMEGTLPASRIRFEFYGNGAVLEDTLNKSYPELRHMFHFYEPIPYDEALGLIATSDYLLFSETSSKGSLSAQGILTTKMFEYVGSGRPIIADISPMALAGATIQKASDFSIVSTDPSDFKRFFTAPGFLMPPQSQVSDFAKGLSRETQARQYAEILDKHV